MHFIWISSSLTATDSAPVFTYQMEFQDVLNGTNHFCLTLSQRNWT